MPFKKPTHKYLSGHAQPEAHAFEEFEYHFDAVLVVPVFDETITFIQGLRPALNSKHLLILIFNAPENATNKALNQTRETLTQLKQESTCLWESEHAPIALLTHKKLNLLIVDRSKNENLIPTKQGVGLARKIGADIACTLITQGNIESPWIYNTDADVKLPTNYFQTHEQSENLSGLIFPFKHTASANPTLSIANILYETKLYYYEAGLTHAQSPYAYHTIGSTMACHYGYYAMARGFNKRAAGEDFYLLNKLAKLAPINTLPAPTIEIDARPSQRVPFGTGTALIDITAMEKPIDEYSYYHPECFEALSQWIKIFPRLWNNKHEILINKLALDSNYFKNTPVLTDAANAFKLQENSEKLLKQCKNKKQFIQQMHIWFDAFKTLKFIHFIRDNKHPSIPLNAIDKQQEFYTLSTDARALLTHH